MSEPGESVATQSSVQAAVAMTIARLPPGHGAPVAHHLDLLSRIAPPPVPSVWTDADAAVVAAMLFARSRRDVLTGGLALVERYFSDARLTRPADLSRAVRVQLLAAAGDYCTALGWPQLGALYGAEALLFADTDGLRYRSLAVLALSHALNGEYDLAEQHLNQASAIFSHNGWRLEDTDYLALLAETLVAPARMSPGGLAAVAEALALARPDDPYWAYTSRAARMMQGLLEGDYDAALAESIRLSTGRERHRSHRMVREFVACIRADILAAQGDPAEALALLAHAQTRRGHGICFPMQRAAALLLLGRERELLAETEACVLDEPDHCLRTLIPTLLLRAIAFLRLGEGRRAEHSMTTALLLLERAGGSLTPFLMLPLNELWQLLDVVGAARPDLAATIARTRSALPAIASRGASEASGAELTPVERTIAELLEGGLSFPEIARERLVSLNTVKSQVRSIYAKLGVASRREAVTMLQRASA